ncbi:MAG: hypothetical protein V4603_10230 [Pseudomonadota bacterium]
MASESLPGVSQSGTDLSTTSKELLDQFLTDTVLSSVKTSKIGDSTLIIGSGGNGEVQGGILVDSDSEIVGSFTGGDLNLQVDLPVGTGLLFEGKDDQNSDESEGYLNTAIGGYFKEVDVINPFQVQHQQSLTNAVDDLLGSLGGGKDISVRLIDFLGKTRIGSLEEQSFALLDSDGSYQGVDSLVGANEIQLDAGTSAGRQVFALNLQGANGAHVLLANVEAAVLAAPGRVTAQGNTSIRIASDNNAQNVTGGGGADTLIGTGSDTLTGGAGNDVFGFNAAGKYTITDFNKAGDSLAFDFAGVTTLDQLKAKVTSVTRTSTDITYNLGADTSVTLIGVSPGDLTAGMIKFTFS